MTTPSHCEACLWRLDLSATEAFAHSYVHLSEDDQRVSTGVCIGCKENYGDTYCTHCLLCGACAGNKDSCKPLTATFDQEIGNDGKWVESLQVGGRRVQLCSCDTGPSTGSLHPAVRMPAP